MLWCENLRVQLQHVIQPRASPLLCTDNKKVNLHVTKLTNQAAVLLAHREPRRNW
jgi:hypothetical protein